MEAYKIYCGGEFVGTGKLVDVTNKFSGETYARTWQADKQVLNKAIAAAVEAKPACAALSGLERYEALRFISAELIHDRQRLGEVLAVESAKPIRYAVGEIDRAAQTFLVAAEESKRLPREYVTLDWTAAGRNREGLVSYFPIGVVAGIAPFNFPMNLAVHKIAPAIAAGCPIVLKPASATPLSTLELAKIIDRTALPKGAVSVLPMDRETGNLLVTDERIQLLSFTGSPVVGWSLKQQSGKKKVVLELGGNAGVIVCASANLEEVVSKALVGAFSYSGQICIHAQRIFVHADLFDRFIAEFVKRSSLLKRGDPLNPETEVSAMIDEENARRVESWIEEARAAGATVLCGGRRDGNFVEPTVLTNTNNRMKICAEEAFGPVVCVEPFKGSIEEAVRQINDSKYGLQCGIFTNRIDELDYAFKHLDVGGVIHNDMPTVRFDHMPYGGIKESGLGREGVKYAIHDMLEPKILVK